MHSLVRKVRCVYCLLLISIKSSIQKRNGIVQHELTIASKIIRTLFLLELIIHKINLILYMRQTYILFFTLPWPSSSFLSSVTVSCSHSSLWHRPIQQKFSSSEITLFCWCGRVRYDIWTDRIFFIVFHVFSIGVWSECNQLCGPHCQQVI